METFLTYFRLELKRAIRMLPGYIGSILFLIMFVFVGTFAIQFFFQEAATFQPLSVAVVTGDDSQEMQLVFQLLENTKSVKSVCEFQYMTEIQAREGIEKGDVDAALLLGDDFYQNINMGRDEPAIVLFPEDAGVRLKVFRALIDSGITMIQTSEAAIYAVSDVAKEYEVPLTRYVVVNMVFDRYLETILTREAFVEEHVVSATGEFDLLQYYMVSGILICLLMSGLSFKFLYEKSEKEIGQKLKVYGIEDMKISVLKISVIGILLWVILAILLLMIKALAMALGVEILFIDVTTVAGSVLLCLSVAVYLHLVYTYTNGGMFLFVFNCVLIICSGVLLPVSYLPEPIGVLSKVSPLTYWNQYSLEVFCGELTAGNVALLIIISGLGIVLSAGKGRMYE